MSFKKRETNSIQFSRQNPVEYLYSDRLCVSLPIAFWIILTCFYFYNHSWASAYTKLYVIAPGSLYGGKIARSPLNA